MHKKNKILTALAGVFFLIMMFLFQSCNSVCSCKQVPCPGYSNENFDEWFAYDSSQQIIYSDKLSQNFDTANILNISTNPPYEAHKGCYNGDNGCFSNKYIYSGLFSFSYNGSLDWDGTVVGNSYLLTVRDFSAQAKNLTTDGFQDIDHPSAFYDQVNLNGKNYQNVQAIWRTDTSTLESGVYKIFIQKNTGLLAFQYYPSNIILVKK